MPAERPPADDSATLQEVLGYLNFSSGKTDPQFLRNLEQLCAPVGAGHDQGTVAPAFRTLSARLTAGLDRLAGTSAAFENVEQARAVVRLAFDEFPARYRAFHRDLLFHQSDAVIWSPLFAGRVCEAILSQEPPWDEDERILDGAIDRLNDYVGHRPLAVLRTAQRMEPYRHEWVRPVPLYIRDVGVGTGPYEQLVSGALEILRATDPALLRDASFDPTLLDELAFDPRAYDFDHPVNKRQNYQFGQWDPHHIDNQGRYRRFVVQQVTLDSLLVRVASAGELPVDELLWEAAAVLAGTMLMASGTSGSGPDAHDSATSLATLLPRIAAYRDAFYEALVTGRTGPHGDRLRAEAVAGKQPLAGARQHLNQHLARRRASQLEHVHLALIYARMGYPEAATRQTHVVPVASARMACEIECRLTAAERAIDAGQLARAAALLAQIEDLLQRAIECGALADPWSILGFQGQFSLFPAPENSVRDHRIDELIALIDEIIALGARLWSEAAARDQKPLAAEVSARMKTLAQWWDQFAPTSVEGIESFSGAEAYESARDVAEALAAFHQAGAAAGDLAFWSKRVPHFNSPKAYALVVTALLDLPDVVAAMALLTQWLSRADTIPLAQGEHSFHALAQRWLAEVCLGGASHAAAVPAPQRSALVSRFFELLEANAEDFWQVPGLDLLGTGLTGGPTDDSQARPRSTDDDDEDDETADGEDLYRAAYDDVVYVDSTSDGVEADMLEAGGPAATDFELDAEARRVGERLMLLRTVATMWKNATLCLAGGASAPLSADVLSQWLSQAVHNQGQLVKLLEAVGAWRIPAPSASRDSLLEFDRRRTTKEILLDRTVSTTVETADAARTMLALLPAESADDRGEPTRGAAVLENVLRAVARGDAAEARRWWPALLEYLETQSILYVPLAKGGNPARLMRARMLQQALRDLVTWLPRLGMLGESCQLVDTARLMESKNPVGPGAISEYDRLFTTGYEAIVESLVDVSAGWSTGDDAGKLDSLLVECLEQATEPLLRRWLTHSRTLRLSALERIGDERSWQELVTFIERFGRDLFTQPFFNIGNLRAILHQGVDVWLARLEADSENEEPLAIVQALRADLPRREAVKNLTLVIEAIVENHVEYRAYNTTTTQSDRGDLLYTLLDFLRLRVHYDRVAWHLKPVLAAHAVLLRRGRVAAAETWRRALAERTSELADALQARYAALRDKYGMRMPTVADRIGERFIRPLAIDRVRALVKPVMDDARQAVGDSTSFDLLAQEVDELAQEPTGVGLDVPGWLLALEHEVEQERRARSYLARADAWRLPLAQVPMTFDEVQQQLSGWEPKPAGGASDTPAPEGA